MMQARAEWMAETLKAIRGEWLTALEFGIEVGVKTSRAKRDLDVLVEQGIATSRKREGMRAKGQRPPMEYTLAQEWGGK